MIEIFLQAWEPPYPCRLQKKTSGVKKEYIINIISKAIDEEYRETVLQLFRIDQEVVFNFENPHFNYLYMHGVISYEETEDFSYVKSPCPFVQEKLFRYFSSVLFEVFHA